jgi:hypothetical protein
MRRQDRMPLCGFNEKMLKGLMAFNEGLVEHGLLERAELRSSSTDEILRSELSDMRRFLAELPRLKDAGMRRIITGLTEYARGMYELIERSGVDDYVRTSQALISYFADMDAEYYSEFEKRRPYDMKALVEYLNSKDRGPYPRP